MLLAAGEGWEQHDLIFIPASVFGTHLGLPTATLCSWDAPGLVWLSVLDLPSRCCDPTGSPGPVALRVWGTFCLWTWKPGQRQAQAVCLDPADRRFPGSHSVSRQETWGLLASLSSIPTLLWGLHHILSTFLPSPISLCLTQGIPYLVWGGDPCFYSSCFLLHLLPYVRSQDSTVAWIGCGWEWGWGLREALLSTPNKNC